MTPLAAIALLLAFLGTIVFFACIGAIWIALGESDVNGEKERDAGTFNRGEDRTSGWHSSANKPGSTPGPATY